MTRSEQRDFDVEQFTTVEVGGALSAVVEPGDTCAVRASGEPRALDDLIVRSRGGHLEVRRSNRRVFKVGRSDCEVVITLPVLDSLFVHGASRLDLIGFDDGRPLEVEASGASKLEGRIRSGPLRTRCHGASKLRLRGLADSLELHVHGASKVDLDDLAVREASATIHGASKVQLGSIDQLRRVRVSGASHVTYHDGAVMRDLRVSGAARFEAV